MSARPARRPGGRRRAARAAGAAALTVAAAAGSLAGAARTAAGTGSGFPADAWPVYHHDAAGSGAAAPMRGVNTAARAWASPSLDGQIYGEPLVSAGRVYVATENDTMYALSAATGAVAWSAHLGSPVPTGLLPCGNIRPVVGITGTPVIDQARGEIFAVAEELVGGRPAHVLVGLSTATGRRELSQNVDPPGANPAAVLQRTGLTLDAGRVVFGLGGNYGDCGAYRGRVVSAAETGGPAAYFTVDATAGDSHGAIWMGGAAPVIDASGRIWVSAGNGSASSSGQAYDNSDSVLELSASLRLLQFFAPASWAADNARDLDMSTAPVLLPDGQVLAAGKAGIVYLLRQGHLGGIGGQRATLPSACSQPVDGGAAISGTTAYLPCTSGVIAVRAASSPAALALRWRSGTGGGPPVLAAGRIWTIGPDGTLYGLDPATGAVRQRVSVGAGASHFPTPTAAGGLLLAASGQHVVAFAESGLSIGGLPSARPAAPGRGGSGRSTTGAIAGVIIAAAVAVTAAGIRLRRRRRPQQS